MSGYTLSYRDKWKDPIFNTRLEAGIWAWMCDVAEWKEGAVRFNEKIYNLQRGQLVTSIRDIASGFEITERRARTLLKKLEKALMIDTQATHKGTILTICNYDKYQSGSYLDDTPNDTQVTHRRHTGDTPIYNDELSKLSKLSKVREEKEITKVISKNKNGSRLPEDFGGEEILEWPCKVLDWPIQQAQNELEKFKDFWKAKAGKDATKLDWVATWRNWCRNSFQARGQPVLPKKEPRDWDKWLKEQYPEDVENGDKRATDSG